MKRHSHSARSIVAVLGLAAMLVVGACSSGSGDDADASGSTATTKAGGTGSSPSTTRAGAKGDSGVKYAVALSGKGVGPKPGDPKGSGKGTVTVTGTKVCATLDLGASAPQVTSVDLMIGKVSEQGPIVSHLELKPVKPTGTSIPKPPAPGERPTLPPIQGCGQIKPPVAARQLAARPTTFNVTVRTSRFPMGAMRGPLVVVEK